MAERRAEALSPLDAATLWPQLHRLDTEVVATRNGETLLFNAGLAAIGIGRIPRLTRTLVVGVRSRLTYQGILVARELAGGAAWEVVSLRLGRDKDDETVSALLRETANEIPARGGRSVFMRYAEGSPHEDAIQRGGLIGFAHEDLLAPPPMTPRRPAPPFRAVARADRAAIFRLYCRAIAAEVRRHEAVTQQEFRAVLDTYACDEEFVLDGEGSLVAWSGAGGREGRVLCDPEAESAIIMAIDLVHTEVGRVGTLVLGQHQETEHRIALERGYTELGTRVVAARRLAALNPLKEALAVPVTSRVPN
jgi:hypothetical protein